MPVTGGVDMATLRIRTEMVGPEEATRALQKLEQQGAKTENAVNRMGASSRRSGADVQKLREPLQALAFTASGADSQLGRLVSTIGLLAAGSTVMIGVLAGLAALSAAYRAITSDARAAREASQEATRELEKLIAARDMARLGAGGAESVALGGAQAELGSLQRDLARVQLTEGGVGSAREAALIAAIERQKDIVARGESELREIRLAAGRQEVKDTNEFHQKRYEAEQRAAEDRKRLAEAEARALAERMRDWVAAHGPGDSGGRAIPAHLRLGNLIAPEWRPIGDSTFTGSNWRAPEDGGEAARAAEANRNFAQTLMMIATVAPESVRGMLSIAAGIKEMGLSAATFSATGFVGVASSVYGTGNSRMQGARDEFLAAVEKRFRSQAIEDAEAVRAQNARHEAILAAEQMRVAEERLSEVRLGASGSIAAEMARVQGFEDMAQAIERETQRREQLREAVELGSDGLVDLYLNLYEMQDAALASARAIRESQQAFEDMVLGMGMLDGKKPLVEGQGGPGKKGGPGTRGYLPESGMPPGFMPGGMFGVPLFNPYNDPLWRHLLAERDRIAGLAAGTPAEGDPYRGSFGAQQAEDAYQNSSTAGVTVWKGMQTFTSQQATRLVDLNFTQTVLLREIAQNTRGGPNRSLGSAMTFDESMSGGSQL